MGKTWKRLVQRRRRAAALEAPAPAVEEKATEPEVKEEVLEKVAKKPEKKAGYRSATKKSK